MMPRVAGRAWYREGLRFTCTRCGNCCGGGPGYVWVSEDEIAALAERLGMDESAFRRRYTRKLKRGVSLVEKANYDCVFYDARKGCTVYRQRPRQCRTWPFWRTNLESPVDWEYAAEGCPGMDRGRLHDAATIAATAAEDGLP